MTDETEIEAPNTLDELALLKERARQMGIPLGGNIGIEALRKKITARLAGSPEEPDEQSLEKAAAPAERRKTKAEIEQETREAVQAEQLALVRCRIYNLNPSKRDLQGEIITVANRYLGTVRKFIPFGEATDGGYHIPRCIYNDLKRRKFQHIKTRKVNGQIKVETRMVPEYQVEVLPMLTKEELTELALQQAAAERLGRPE